MHAVIGHLKTSLRTFSLHAVLWQMDVESFTTGNTGKKQMESLFESEKRLKLDQTTGIVRRLLISPAYKMPGSDVPLFLMGCRDMVRWGPEPEEMTNNQAYFTHVQLDVKNDGKKPLYVIEIVERKDGHGVEKIRGFRFAAGWCSLEKQIVPFKAILLQPWMCQRAIRCTLSQTGFQSRVLNVTSRKRKDACASHVAAQCMRCAVHEIGQ
ncbi:unnamed protein product [Peronospora destructor]|uniref:Uncharacterized protein n=1 Tax=Peronospora destructor TaxID=86335 RepID=A0AAV0UEL1_9STRA|nr:unnamed protein product [Peronospora destructor]